MSKNTPSSSPRTDSTEQIRARLNVIRDYNRLIFREKNRRWEPIDICRSLVINGGYANCWIVTTDRRGSILEMAHSSLPPDKYRFDMETILPGIRKFTGRTLKTENIIINKSPVYAHETHATGNETGTLSARIAYNGNIYGVISVSLKKR